MITQYKSLIIDRFWHKSKLLAEGKYYLKLENLKNALENALNSVQRCQ